MNKQDKELLLKDLCARLPYNVICCNTSLRCNTTLSCSLLEQIIANENIYIKPYLRSMSSMNEKELKEFIDVATWQEYNGTFHIDECQDITFYQEKYDWLNAHHFDVRHLIEKGLAIDCTELNIY